MSIRNCQLNEINLNFSSILVKSLFFPLINAHQTCHTIPLFSHQHVQPLTRYLHTVCHIKTPWQAHIQLHWYSHTAQTLTRRHLFLKATGGQLLEHLVELLLHGALHVWLRTARLCFTILLVCYKSAYLAILSKYKERIKPTLQTDYSNIPQKL